MLQYGDRMGKAKVAGVGHAGNTFALLEAGEPGNQGPHDGWRPAGGQTRFSACSGRTAEAGG